MSGAVNRQSESYRHGVVLGLTMAELMMLLVFCLLIALALILAVERAEKDKAVDTANLLSNAMNFMRDHQPGLVEQAMTMGEVLAPTGGPSAVGEDWRRLVAARETVDALSRVGVDPSRTKEIVDALSLADTLVASGVTPQDVASQLQSGQLLRDARFGRAVDESMRKAGLGPLSPSALANAAKTTLAAAGKPEGGPGGHRWPPIINLSEADGHFFDKGSAVLNPGFSKTLRGDIPDKLLEISSSFDVDVIEVIGHTDEQPLATRQSNLDRELPNVLKGKNVASLTPADNAGLGLARALAVANVLSTDPRLSAFRILPLSGAQLIDTSDRLSKPGERPGDVRERRRIEIRMRKAARP